MNKRLSKNFLTKNDLINVANDVTTLKEARLRLGMSLSKFRKFAQLYLDEETGLDYYELIRRKKNKGNVKIRYTPIVKQSHKPKRFELKLILEGFKRNILPDEKLKFFTISGGWKPQICETCGFEQKRSVDYKVPLKLLFKDGKRYNGKLENLEFICYNCHFLHHPNYKLIDEDFYDVSVNTVSNKIDEKRELIDTKEDLEDFDKVLQRVNLKNIKKQQEQNLEKDYSNPYLFVTNKNLINNN